MPTVLYVDDHPAMARAVKRWLVARGTSVHAVRTLAEARDHFAAGAYDGVFVDLWLHDGSGFELYDWIVEHRPALADRVAFVTADIVRHNGEQARFAALDRPVLLKPFDMAELDRWVERWTAGYGVRGTGYGTTPAAEAPAAEPFPKPPVPPNAVPS